MEDSAYPLNSCSYFLFLFSLVHFASREILHSLIPSKAEVQWDGLNKINPEDFITGPVGTTEPQTPPPGVIEVQSRTNTARR